MLIVDDYMKMLEEVAMAYFKIASRYLSLNPWRAVTLQTYHFKFEIER
jgi:hypothetical protein